MGIFLSFLLSVYLSGILLIQACKLNGGILPNVIHVVKLHDAAQKNLIKIFAPRI